MAHLLHIFLLLGGNHHICAKEMLEIQTKIGTIKGSDSIRSDSSLAIFFGHARTFLLDGRLSRVVHYRQYQRDSQGIVQVGKKLDRDRKEFLSVARGIRGDR